MRRLWPPEGGCGCRVCPSPLPAGLLAGEPAWLRILDWGLAEAAAPGSGPALREAVLRLGGGGLCAVCGAPAAVKAGSWEILAGGGSAEARLVALVPLCGACRLAYWPVEAAARGVMASAASRLARVCGSREQALKAMERALAVERELNTLAPRWRISLDKLAGLLGLTDEEARELSRLATVLANKPWAVDWQKLVLHAPAALAATGCLEEICRGDPEDLAHRAAEEARRHGLQADPKAIAAAVRRLRQRCHDPAPEPPEGYWTLLLHPAERSALYSRAARQREAPWTRIETPPYRRDPVEVRVYTPCILDPATIAQALREAARLAGRQPPAAYRTTATPTPLYVTI